MKYKKVLILLIALIQFKVEGFSLNLVNIEKLINVISGIYLRQNIQIFDQIVSKESEDSESVIYRVEIYKHGEISIRLLKDGTKAFVLEEGKIAKEYRITNIKKAEIDEY